MESKKIVLKKEGGEARERGYRGGERKGERKRERGKMWKRDRRDKSEGKRGGVNLLVSVLENKSLLTFADLSPGVQRSGL